VQRQEQRAREAWREQERHPPDVATPLPAVTEKKNFCMCQPCLVAKEQAGNRQDLNFYLLQVTLHWPQGEDQLRIAVPTVLLKTRVEPASSIGAYIPVQGITINFQKFQ